MIDFEKDQEEVLTRTKEIKSLSDQVLKLRTLEDEFKTDEELLKKFNTEDFLLLTGDPALIGVACSIVSDITGGKYKLLKWDKQENKYYPITINLYEKGKIDE